MDFCKSQGIVQSMSKAECPYDNDPMERFYKTFKDELVYRYQFMNVKALDDAVAQYIFVWYNLQKESKELFSLAGRGFFCIFLIAFELECVDYHFRF